VTLKFLVFAWQRSQQKGIFMIMSLNNKSTHVVVISTHVVGITNNLLNKYNCPTNAHEDFSIDASTLKILLFSSIKSLDSTIDYSSTSDLHVCTIGFSTSKIVIIR
jgi:hypothetical protein